MRWLVCDTDQGKKNGIWLTVKPVVPVFGVAPFNVRLLFIGVSRKRLLGL